MIDNHDGQTEIPSSGDGQAPAEAAAQPGTDSAALDPEDRMGLQLHTLADQLVKDLGEVLEEHPVGKIRQLAENLATNVAPLRDALAEMLQAAGHLL